MNPRQAKAALIHAFGVILVAVPMSRGAEPYAGVGAKLSAVVEEEMRVWNIRGIAIALVDDQRVIHIAGYGEARPDSAFRVGSISKLFTAVAVMQQVEAGRLDLDAPLPPELRPINPFAGTPEPTLRQILCHRSGLPREPTVGGYLDNSEPGLEATVASVVPSVLVTRPGEKTRYSNLGPSIAGRFVEKVTGEDFEDYQQRHILGPLAMTNSAWTLRGLPRGRLIESHMRVTDGRGGWEWRAAPVFDLGTIPAGNLFSSAGDLARFASALMVGGGQLLRPETLAEMWRPQLTQDESGFGIAFMVGKYRGHRSVSHSGAVYGHSTSLVVLPEEKIAVIVLGNEDVANARIRRISNVALSMMLAAKLGEAPPDAPATFIPQNLEAFAGDYESQSYWAHLEVREGRLIGDLSGQPTRFTPTADLRFAADSRIEDANPAVFERDGAGTITGFSLGTQRYERVSGNGATLPPEWRRMLGRYGPNFIPLVVSERHGHLYVMTENMVDYRLTPVNRNACLLPPGMYVDEQVVFLRDRRGAVREINFANMNFRRRN